MLVAIYQGPHLLDVVADKAPRRAWKAAEQAVRRYADRHGEAGGKGWFRDAGRVGYERGSFRAMLLAHSAPRSSRPPPQSLASALERSINVYTKR